MPGVTAAKSTSDCGWRNHFLLKPDAKNRTPYLSRSSTHAVSHRSGVSSAVQGEEVSGAAAEATAGEVPG
jgi:hypothetical protein